MYGYLIRSTIEDGGLPHSIVVPLPVEGLHQQCLPQLDILDKGKVRVSMAAEDQCSLAVREAMVADLSGPEG